MPEQPSDHSEEPTNPNPQKPEPRRVSNKIARKVAKRASKKEAAPEADNQDNKQSGKPAPQAASEALEKQSKPEENEAGQQQSKHNNRRRRGKGKSSAPGQKSDRNNEGEAPALSRDESGESPDPRGQSNPKGQARHKNQRARHDSTEVAKKAWKIFLAEVSEEGVALIGDNDARELTRRCFRLAELFLEEENLRN